jgi:hypothetical protein
VIHEFEMDVKAKSGFVEAGGLLWFATEKGGSGNGSIETVAPNTGSVTSVAPLSLQLGIKVESLVASADGRLIYAGAREGGDAAELSGKGAGACWPSTLPMARYKPWCRSRVQDTAPSCGD